MSEQAYLYLAPLIFWVFTNFCILLAFIGRFQRLYEYWKNREEWWQTTSEGMPNWEFITEAEKKSKYNSAKYKKYKKLTFWLSPVLIFTIFPLLLIWLLKEACVWAYEVYND